MGDFRRLAPVQNTSLQDSALTLQSSVASNSRITPEIIDATRRKLIFKKHFLTSDHCTSVPPEDADPRINTRTRKTEITPQAIIPFPSSRPHAWSSWSGTASSALLAALPEAHVQTRPVSFFTRAHAHPPCGESLGQVTHV